MFDRLDTDLVKSSVYGLWFLKGIIFLNMKYDSTNLNSLVGKCRSLKIFLHKDSNRWYHRVIILYSTFVYTTECVTITIRAKSKLHFLTDWYETPDKQKKTKEKNDCLTENKLSPLKKSLVKLRWEEALHFHLFVEAWFTVCCDNVVRLHKWLPQADVDFYSLHVKIGKCHF